MSKDPDAALMADIEARLDGLPGDDPGAIHTMAAELASRHYHRSAQEIEEKITACLSAKQASNDR